MESGKSFLSRVRLLSAISVLLFVATGNAQTIELNFTGAPNRESVVQLKKTLEAAPGHLQSRIAKDQGHIWASFQPGTAPSERRWSDLLAEGHLQLACYLDHGDLEEHPEMQQQFRHCRATHRSTQKTAAFNTCSTPLDICDGDTINVTTWGPGLDILNWPDPPRNPEYDSFALPALPSPWVNPWLGGTNLGCLQSGEQNTIWLRMVVTTAGQLEWSFQFPEEDSLFNFVYMDWSLFPGTPTICADIAANNANSAPLRCNWNDLPESPFGATGMVSNAAFLPIGNEEDNFELSLPVNAGDQFLLLLDNFSGADFPGIFDFSLSPSSAQVCGIVLSHGHTELAAVPLDEGVSLSWVNLGPQDFASYQFERAGEDGVFANWETVSEWEFVVNPHLIDESPLPGTSYYRIHKKDDNGQSSFSNVVTVDWVGHGFEVFPNPVSGKYFELWLYEPAGSVRIFNATGQLVFHEDLAGRTGRLELAPELPSGVYSIEVSNLQGVLLQKKFLVL